MALALASYVAGIEDAGVPLVVLRVRAAKPALAFIAEDLRGHIARLIQTGNRIAGRLRFAGRIFPGWLCSHNESLPGFYSEPDARDRQLCI